MVNQKQANVKIVNDTGARIRAVSIVHKYSDNYTNTKTWDVLESGARSSAMPVQYNTGAFTTGRDWWWVGWMSDDGRIFHYSNPHNLRSIVDMIEGAATGIASAIGGIVTSETGGWGAAVGAAMTAPFVNSSKTIGFKQHILRDEDFETLIHISNEGIRWVSPSGTSETGVATSSIVVHQHA